LGNRVKKMKPGKLTGPSHKKGGILLEAEGGEYIIKKSSVKKIGKAKLDKINKEGNIMAGTDRSNTKGGKWGKPSSKNIKKVKPPIGKLPYPGWKPGDHVPPMRGKPPIGKMPKGWKPGDPVPPMKATPLKKKRGGGKVGSSIKTYSSGGYVEGK